MRLQRKSARRDFTTRSSPPQNLRPTNPIHSVSYFLGIDLGGSSVKAVAVTATGQLLRQEHFDFEATQPMAWAGKIREVVGEFENGLGRPADGLGLSAPGLVAQDGRSIAHMPGRLQGLEGLVWSDYLTGHKSVPVLNDAQAALLGEVCSGAARGFRDVILLTLGTGVGGAIMANGQLLRGHIGRAGHLGHISLNPEGPPDIVNTPGSLEDAIGNATILQRTDGRFYDTHSMVRACLTEDPFATEVWLKSVRALACAITSFVNVLDPEAVIIGGGIAAAGDALFKPLASFLDEVEWRPGGQRVKILPAQLGEFAGAMGAAWNAVQRG